MGLTIKTQDKWIKCDINSYIDFSLAYNSDPDFSEEDSRDSYSVEKRADDVTGVDERPPGRPRVRSKGCEEKSESSSQTEVCLPKINR